MTNVDALWAETCTDKHGLVPCVVQDLRTRAVLMVSWVSKEALLETVATGWATYYSRSRKTVWQKGSTSGNRQKIVHIRLDCDGDTLHYLVEAGLPTCHEGPDSCFSRRRVGATWVRDPMELRQTHSTTSIEELQTNIDCAPSEPTSVREIVKESEELADALNQKAPDEQVVSEGADLLYRLGLALKERSLTFQMVFDEIENRFGGTFEKKAQDVGENLYATRSSLEKK